MDGSAAALAAGHMLPDRGFRGRVFVDGYNLAMKDGTGVATYAANLCVALRGMGHEVGVLYGKRSSRSRDALVREVSFFDPRASTAPRWRQSLQGFRSMARHPFGQVADRIGVSGTVLAQGMPEADEIWNVPDLFAQSYLAFDTLGGRLRVRVPERPPALMHWTYPLPLRLAGAKNIYTMHDLVPLRLPYTTLDNKRRYLRLCRMLARRADHIVTVSEASRRDIVQLLGVPEDRVTNTYQSVELPEAAAAMPEADLRCAIAGGFGLELRGYYLFFGAIEPKKNVGRLIEAYLASGVAGPLVIVGKKAWKSEDELRLMFDDSIRYQMREGSRTVTRHRVMLLDYVPARLLTSLVRGAKAVLFPSLYEGFGLPAVEAMQLGTPVITSNTASLPELVGDAALTVDPYDVRALTQAIQAVDADAALRRRLSAAGPVRAAMFGRARYQERLAALYERVSA